MQHYATLVCSLLVLPLLTGCGERLSTVTGQVTLDGRPLARGPELVGTVQFVPQDGGPTATAYLDESGRYNLSSGSRKGTQPGHYLVAVSATKIISADTEGGAASGRPATPRHYANPKESGFSVDVEPGDNSFDFALVSSGRQK
jgi:hypothetical protein